MLLNRIKIDLARYRKTKIVGIFIRKFVSFGIRLRLNYENLNYDHYSNGEHFVLKAMRNEQFDTIFDVGANIGNWAYLAHEVFPDATIHCFEIMKDTYEKLARRAEETPNIIVCNHGLSHQNEEVMLKHFPHASGLTTMVEPLQIPENAEMHFADRLQHHYTKGIVITGDSYVQNAKVNRINFLKIDVEGADYLVLKGFTKTIDMKKVDLIQFEYGRANIFSKFLLYDFYLFLKEKGYQVGKIYPNYVEFRDYSVSHEDFIGPNFLAVRKERSDLIDLLS